jgi:prepilin-type N-terminal cleavage/methylation domain-containing protein
MEMAGSTEEAGYTLIEVVIAILVFGVGVLGLAASSGVVVRARAANSARERAELIATSRIELLRSQCGNAGSGEEHSHGISSQWVVSPNGSSALNVVESVTYAASDGSRIDIYRAIIWCPQ